MDISWMAGNRAGKGSGFARKAETCDDGVWVPDEKKTSISMAITISTVWKHLLLWAFLVKYQQYKAFSWKGAQRHGNPSCWIHAWSASLRSRWRQYQVNGKLWDRERSIIAGCRIQNLFFYKEMDSLTLKQPGVSHEMTLCNRTFKIRCQYRRVYRHRQNRPEKKAEVSSLETVFSHTRSAEQDGSDTYHNRTARFRYRRGRNYQKLCFDGC
jgi:hypothetical protein